MHLPRLVFTLPLVALLFAPAAPAQPSPEVGVVETHVERIYYEVAGTTAAELAAELERYGPVFGQERFFGRTEWEVTAQYEWVERDTGCGIERLRIWASIEVLLPQWRPTAEATPELVRGWRAFIEALTHHEEGHRRLAEEAADAIRWRLVSMHAPSCEGIEAVAQREVQFVLDEYERRNRRYDRTTLHGRTQGATWPPSEE